MATKKPDPLPKPATPAFRGYVRRDLQSEEDVAAFRQYESKEDATSVLSNLFGCVDGGYKVSLKIDGKGYKVELFNVSGPEETRGYILSAYGSSVRKALTAVHFKHFELLGEAWENYVNLEAPEVRLPGCLVNGPRIDVGLSGGTQIPRSPIRALLGPLFGQRDPFPFTPAMPHGGLTRGRGLCYNIDGRCEGGMG